MEVYKKRKDVSLTRIIKLDFLGMMASFLLLVAVVLYSLLK